ncbi:GNAT family N-acetyltransferase [Pseudoduganella sp. UC29_106]|uniref:GNAT family N-acetyltransferase n=1 Tax=Pseudoduganella sp. UC29_106 TaxID=3374553 RepID=UPI003757D8C7
MKELLKRLAHLVLGEYSIYQILQRSEGQAAIAAPAGAGFRITPVTRADIEASNDPVMREQAGYAGEGALAYACWHDDQIAGLCFYWHGARYLPRNFWPLQADEAKLVQVITSPRMRGRKVAGTLIALSCADVMTHGFKRTFARVWHSNTPSLRAFAGAGWTRCAMVIEINPFRQARPWRLRLP